MIDHRRLTTENVRDAVVQYLDGSDSFMGGRRLAEELFNDWLLDTWVEGYNEGFQGDE